MIPALYVDGAELPDARDEAGHIRRNGDVGLNTHAAPAARTGDQGDPPREVAHGNFREAQKARRPEGATRLRDGCGAV